MSAEIIEKNDKAVPELMELRKTVKLIRPDYKSCQNLIGYKIFLSVQKKTTPAGFEPARAKPKRWSE